MKLHSLKSYSNQSRRAPLAGAQSFSRAAAALSAAGLLLLSAAGAQADNLVLNGTDSINTSSFTNPLTGSGKGWGPTADAPIAGNTYEVPNGLSLRTPGNANSYTFPGDSLTIDNGGRLLIKANAKSVATAPTLTVNNLILNGGLADYANATAGGPYYATLAGNITLADGTSSHLGALAGEIFTISSNISGSGNVDFGIHGTTYAGGTINDIGQTILTGNNTATGTMTITGATTTLDSPGTDTTQATAAVNGGDLVIQGDGVYADHGTSAVGIASYAASNQLGNTTGVTLSGGLLELNGFSEGAASRNGAGDSTVTATGAGTLTLSDGTTSFLDFGPNNTAASAPITFAFSGVSGAGSLYIYNYYGNPFDPASLLPASGGGLDELFLGSSATPGQLDNIYFVNPNGQTGTFQAFQLASGEVVAPEPSEWLSLGLGLLCLGGLAIKARRRAVRA